MLWIYRLLSVVGVWCAIVSMVAGVPMLFASSYSGGGSGGGGGGGDALVANPLSQFAPTTSLQLLGVITNETGTGVAVFNDTPTILTPTIASFANAGHAHTNAAGGGTLAEGALALTDITTNNASTSAHGFMPKGTGSTSTFYRSDGTQATPAGGGDALVANPLSQFAPTTSLQLLGVITNETGTGVLVFNDTPTLIAPLLGTPTSVVLTNATGLPLTSGVTGLLPAANMAATTVNSVVNDTNITGSIAAQALTLGWTGTLAKARIIATAVYNDQANIWTTGAQDMGAATSFKMPVAAGATTATNGFLAYDSINHMLHASQTSADAKIPQFTVTPANSDCVTWVVSGSQYKLGTAGAACGSGGSGISSATANGALYATGATTGTSTAALTNGQMLIGSTGVPPVAGTIAGTTNKVGVTEGAGTLTLNTGTLVVHTDQANTWSTGAQDMGAATSFKMPVAAGATTATNGFMAYDSTNNMLHASQTSADAKIPQFTVTPANSDCVTWVVSGSQYKLGTAGAACGIGNVSNTGTPTSGQLALWTSATVLQGVTALPAANFPALTGAVTSSAGALATTPGTVVKSVSIPAGAMDTTGACINNAPAVLIASGPKLPTITCTDIDTDGIEFDLKTPNNWNASTIQIELDAFSIGNNTTEVLSVNFSGQCVRTGDSVAAHTITSGATATSGSNVAATITWGASASREQFVTTSALTLNGTCAAGAHVYLHGLVNATATTMTPMTDLKILGVRVIYTATGVDS